MTTTDDRAAYSAGLRQLADLLDAHPEIPLPYDGRPNGGTPITIHHLDGNRGAFAATVRALPGRKEKAVHGDYYDVNVSLHGLRLTVAAFRDTVCERIVTGTREVTREVRDPDALAAVPTTTVTETVEDVEWVCSPLTAPAADDLDSLARADEAVPA